MTVVAPVLSTGSPSDPKEFTMTTIDIETAPTTEDAAGEFAGQLFESGLATMELLSVYVGLRLGTYRVLAEGAANAAELASAAGIHPRYAREWLEQQTVAGFLACEDRSVSADERRYSLPAAQAIVLLADDHPACCAPLALAVAGVAGILPELLDAYRTGGGVPYARYGTDFREGQAGFNRAGFVNSLAESWLADGAPEIDARLRSGTPRRIADVACGSGWSSISFAIAYPAVMVDGFDIDEASIADARSNAAASSVSDRVRFEVRDAANGPEAGEHGTYELVTIFEALHDMAHPVEALSGCRALCAPGGSVIVMDQKTADSFAESDGPIERFAYGASVLHCLPVGMAEHGSAGTGTVMRLDTIRGYASAAGFSRLDVLPIEHDLFRFYHLIP
jgi:Methyltransferase domain